jgi:transcription-repair coupling factor (superfamily II helicase)
LHSKRPGGKSLESPIRHTHIDIQVTTLADPMTTIMERLEKCEHSIRSYKENSEQVDNSRLEQLEALLSNVKYDIAQHKTGKNETAARGDIVTDIAFQTKNEPLKHVEEIIHVTPDMIQTKRRLPPKISPSDFRDKVNCSHLQLIEDALCANS